MYLLIIPFSFFEITVFALAVIAFLLAVRFFIASQKRLEGLLPGRQGKAPQLNIGIDRDGFLVPTVPNRKQAAERDQKATAETRQELKELRDMVQLQQIELSRALRQIETLHASKEADTHEEEAYAEESAEPEEPYTEGDDFLIEELRNQVARKESEIKELQQQAVLSQRLQAHFDDVQTAHEELQLKVQKMEGQTRQSAELTLTIDSLEQSVEQARKAVQKKEEKIRELTAENGRLQHTVNEAEGKLSEAAQQRQQLMKKIFFLEEMAGDMQQMSDATRKLKTEVRRVGELESMLDLITEERDALLKRKKV